MLDIPPCLWISILKYIDPFQYKECRYINRKYNQLIDHPEIHKWVQDYLDNYMKGLEIESEEEDNRDDCGVFCHVCFLNNGMILDRDEYLDLYQEELNIIHYYFPWYHHSSSSLLFKNIS